MSMKIWLRAAFILSICSTLWLIPGFVNALDAEQARNDAQSAADRLQDAPASLPLTGNGAQRSPFAAPQSVIGVPVSNTPNSTDQGRLAIDPQTAQYLATTGCSVPGNSANSPIASGITTKLNIPTGSYPHLFGTNSGTRYFNIVGNDCEYLTNSAAPSVRMLSAHRMANGYIYVALFNMRGDVLGFLHQTGQDDYDTIDIDHGRTQEIEMIYADLKSETQGWIRGVNHAKSVAQQQALDGGSGSR